MREDRRSYALVVLAVLTVAIAMRLLPLHWTAYPFNPDGFQFARRAHNLLANGGLPSDIGPHRIGFTVLLAMAAKVTNVAPLWMGQPVIAIVGAGPPLLAVAFARRIASGRGWSTRMIAVAALLAGLVLATEGPYLRRTVGVHYEAVGLLLVPMLALAAHRWFGTRNYAWGLLAALTAAVLPITHHFSAVIGGVTLLFLVALWWHRTATRFTVATGGVLAGGYWLYVVVYYVLTEPEQIERLTGNPGLFVAWLVVGVCVVLWTRRANERAVMGIVSVVFGTIVALLLVNTLNVFPGTASTPAAFTWFLVPVGVIALFAVAGIGSVLADTDVGAVVVVLLLGPAVIVFFALSAGITPEFTMTARRGQTFFHLAAIATAALGAVRVGRVANERVDRRRLRRGIRVAGPTLLVVCSLLTVPLAFGGLQLTSYEGTTTDAEFQSATFAVEHLPSSWASDDHIVRVASNYYDQRANGQVSPVYAWTHGDPPPACPTVASLSWTTVGAQLFPDGPATIADARYHDWQATRNVVYRTSGGEEHAIVFATGDARDC